VGQVGGGEEDTPGHALGERPRAEQRGQQPQLCVRDGAERGGRQPPVEAAQRGRVPFDPADRVLVHPQAAPDHGGEAGGRGVEPALAERHQRRAGEGEERARIGGVPRGRVVQRQQRAPRRPAVQLAHAIEGRQPPRPRMSVDTAHRHAQHPGEHPLRRRERHHTPAFPPVHPRVASAPQTGSGERGQEVGVGPAADRADIRERVVRADPRLLLAVHPLAPPARRR
jgi:hypothetical protein